MAAGASASPADTRTPTGATRISARVMLNALLWIAKVDVPDGGVKDNITADDLTKNLDEKPPRK